MALKTSVAVLLSLNLLFFATLSSSSALPPAAPAPQPSSCPIDIRDLRVCETTLVAFARSPGRNKNPGLKGNIDQCCEVIRRGADEAGVCICSAIKAGIWPFNIHDMIEPFSDLLEKCGVHFDLVVQVEKCEKS